MLLFVTYAFDYLYWGITQMIFEGVKHNASGVATISQDVLTSTQTIKTHNLIIVFTSSTLLTMVFGYFIARVTLAPTRDALESQKRFISDIAHELRTPLSVIKTNSEVALLDRSLDPHMKRTLVSNIEELDRTSEIINNLLTFSNWVRTERIKFENVDLAVVVGSAIKKLKVLIEGKQHTITVRKQPPHTVWGNVAALEQIVVNLLKNAINYTGARGQIFVTVMPDYEGGIVLTVQDTGIGIMQKDLVHIFEPFYRAERSRSRQSGSSGLGLTIVSELIKLHHGKITIKSKPNVGTTVMVVFPYSKTTTLSLSGDAEGHNKKKGESDEISLNFLGRQN